MRLLIAIKQPPGFTDADPFRGVITVEAADQGVGPARHELEGDVPGPSQWFRSGGRWVGEGQMAVLASDGLQQQRVIGEQRESIGV